MTRPRRTLAGLLICLSACSSATIYRHNAPDLEASIVGGEADYLYVETEDGRVVRIARKNVTEIDHPGNVEAVIGGILLACAAVMVGVANTSSDPGGETALYSAGGAYGLAGVILLADGLIAWNRSTTAAEDTATHLPLRVRKGDFGAPAALPLAQSATAS